MPVHARGVSQIKTLAAVRGSGVHSNERHVRQFQIASLELERSRRARERQAAMARIHNIDARVLEIDTLIQRHQESLGVSGGAGDKVPCETKAAATEKRRMLRY